MLGHMQCTHSVSYLITSSGIEYILLSGWLLYKLLVGSTQAHNDKKSYFDLIKLSNELWN